MSAVTCGSCGAVSRCFEDFLSLQLPIPAGRVVSLQVRALPERIPVLLQCHSKLCPSALCVPLGVSAAAWMSATVPRILTLTRTVSPPQDCLKAFTDSEALDEDAGFHCEACNRRVGSATKRLSVQRCPPVLVLTLNRFSVCTFLRCLQTHGMSRSVLGQEGLAGLQISCQLIILLKRCTREIIQLGAGRSATGMARRCGEQNHRPRHHAPLSPGHAALL